MTVLNKATMYNIVSRQNTNRPHVFYGSQLLNNIHHWFKYTEVCIFYTVWWKFRIKIYLILPYINTSKLIIEKDQNFRCYKIYKLRHSTMYRDYDRLKCGWCHSLAQVTKIIKYITEETNIKIQMHSKYLK